MSDPNATLFAANNGSGAYFDPNATLIGQPGYFDPNATLVGIEGQGMSGMMNARVRFSLSLTECD